MTGSLLWLAIACLVVLITHFGLSWRPVRGPLAGLLGDQGFRGVYSVVALAAFVWMVLAWRQAPLGPVLWRFGGWGVGFAHFFILAGLIMLACGAIRTNPTLSGRMIGRDEPVRIAGALRITRHPLMWGIGLWGIGHLIANGETRTVLMMGTITVLALLGTVILDAKYTGREPERYGAFRRHTSNLPFLSLLAGEQPWGRMAREVGQVRVGVGVLLYLVLFYAHPWLGGVALSY